MTENTKTTTQDTKQLADWLHTLHNSAQLIAQNQFKQWCFEHIKQLVNFDSALWISRSDMDDKVNVHWRDDACLYNQAPGFIENYAKIDAQPQNVDHLNQRLLSSPGEFFSIWECCDKQQFMQSSYYLEHCVPYHIENAISALMLPGEFSSISHIFSFYRADTDNDFSQQDKQLAGFIFPHILEAYQSNLLSSFTDKTTTRFHGIIDRFGKVVMSQTGFIEYLKTQGLYRDSTVNIAGIENLTSASEIHIGDSHLKIDYQDGLFYIDIKDLSKQLTSRQIEIGRYAAKGYSNQEIGKMLGLSPNTINNHLSKIFQKLGINCKTKLISFLINEKLFSQDIDDAATNH